VAVRQRRGEGELRAAAETMGAGGG
jgi:hypothetical protein